MKNVKKLSILLSIIPMLLTACDNEKKAYCLETCDAPDYVQGQCYQASRKDILESVHLIALPLNPDKGADEEYKYPLTWSNVINTEFFYLLGGLEGKKVLSVLKLGENVIKVNISVLPQIRMLNTVISKFTSEHSNPMLKKPKKLMSMPM